MNEWMLRASLRNQPPRMNPIHIHGVASIILQRFDRRQACPSEGFLIKEHILRGCERAAGGEGGHPLTVPAANYVKRTAAARVIYL